MTRSDVATAEELWAAARRHFPELSDEQQRAGIVLLRELAKGEPLAVADLARALGASVETAEATAAGLPLVHAGAGGRLQGFWGLSVTPTHHQLTVKGRKLWAWCAEDSLFLPELIGDAAAIESRDPETDQLIRLTVSADGIQAVEPAGVVVSMRRPEAWDAASATRIMASACHFIFFFATRESGERWAAKHPGVVLLSLDDAFWFAKQSNARMFGIELTRRRANGA